MLFKVWSRFLSPIQSEGLEDAAIREIRFLRIIGLILALTYPTWYWVNANTVTPFQEPFWPRLVIGSLGLLAAVATRFSKILEGQMRAIFYGIALLLGIHMLYLVNQNNYHLSYTTDALTTLMLVEFCMPAMAGAIGFPLLVIAMAAISALAAPQSQAWFFFGLLAETLVVAFVIVAARLKQLAEINRTSKAFKEAKLAAEAANEAKSRFLAVMSHEIRTPMNSILGLVELMNQDALPEEQKSHLRDIHAGAELLLGLVNDLLDLSRIESGRVDLEKIPFSLHDWMRKTLSLVNAQAEIKGIHLRYVTRGLPDPLWVLGDPLRTQQTIYNLLSNALKFTEQGWVTLVVESVDVGKQQVKLRIAVRDTGIGIPAEKLKAIFESFVQADSSTARRFGGSGLGLAIARELIGLMGGRIEVASREGSGSEFFFEITLPRTEPSKQADRLLGSDVFASATDEGNSSEGNDEPGQGLRVFVVDDNPVNLKVAKAMLSRLGCKVATAKDGSEALALLQNPTDFDLVFMDCQMPHMDGYTTTQQIRKQEIALKSARLPIIALTANAMQGERLRCEDAGMDDYLSKPVQLAQLRSVLRRWGHRPPSGELPVAGGAVA